MISTTAEYALRAVLLLAVRDADGSMRADEIADAIDAPRNYLSKTLRVLAHAGLIDGFRGPNGGFRLAVDPRNLTVAMIVDLFDEARDPSGCPVPECRCTRSAPCPVSRWWLEIETAGRESIESTSVAHLLRRRAEWKRATATQSTRKTSPRRIPAGSASR